MSDRLLFKPRGLNYESSVFYIILLAFSILSLALVGLRFLIEWVGVSFMQIVICCYGHSYLLIILTLEIQPNTKIKELKN